MANNTFGTITIETPDATYQYQAVKFTAGTTQTCTDFVADGAASYKITITSPTGAQHTLSCASGTIDVSNCKISYSNATGGATWNAFTSQGNEDQGNNTGWNFVQLYETSMLGGLLSGGQGQLMAILSYLMAGGDLAGGTIIPLRLASIPGVGGSIVGGQAFPTKIGLFSAQAGAISGGLASYLRFLSIASQGGDLAGGQALQSVLAQRYALGGALIGAGDILPQRIFAFSGQGGDIAGGQALPVRTAILLALAGGLSGGTAPYQFIIGGVQELIVEMLGGFLAGGLSGSTRIKLFGALGGLLAGGTDQYLRLATPSMGGGFLSGGLWPPNFVFKAPVSGGALAGASPIIPIRIARLQGMGGSLAGALADVEKGIIFVPIGGFLSGGIAIYTPIYVGQQLMEVLMEGGFLSGGSSGVVKLADLRQLVAGGGISGGFSELFWKKVRRPYRRKILHLKSRKGRPGIRILGEEIAPLEN